MLTTEGKIHKIARQNNGKEKVSGMTSFPVLVVRRRVFAYLQLNLIPTYFRVDLCILKKNFKIVSPFGATQETLL